MGVKELIKRIYERHFEPDIAKLRKLQKLKEQYQHFETLNAPHTRVSCNITIFARQEHIVRLKEIKALEKELKL